MVIFAGLSLTALSLHWSVSQILFVILSVASVADFCRSVFRRLGVKTLQLFHVPVGFSGKRLWRVFLEVFLQYRVIRDRPVVGVLHALVLWGFVAFIGVSLEHLSLGLRGLQHATYNHHWYGWFAALWAILVLVGIAGLSFRRFVLKPQALGKLSVTSGIVALLIFILMMTYLLEWKVLSIGSSSWNGNWWLHTIAFFAILVVIPRSKHFHLVLAPVAILFRSETTSKMRPLQQESEDLGMVRFNDLSPKDILDVNACVECGRCTDACPANLIGKSLNPKEVILQMQRGLLSGGELVAGNDAEVRDGKAWVAEKDLFQCFSCGACEEVCPVGIEHVGKKILDLRRGLVSEGRINHEKIANLFTTMERSPHNPFGFSSAVRQKFIEVEKFPIFDGSQEWLFWLGCGNSYDAHGQKVAKAMKVIFDSAGLSWGVLEREVCCGEPARRAGNELLFFQLSDKLMESFSVKKVKKIVTCCPHCATMLDVDYRQLPAYASLGIKIFHHSQFLNRLISHLPIEPRRERVSFHDPCYLARGKGITREPRQILKACGVSVIEPPQHGKHTFCCGAGGAQLFVTDERQEKRDDQVNYRRFNELVATNSRVIAVACPYCPVMLEDAAHHANREDISILDISEILANSLRDQTPVSSVAHSHPTAS